MFGLFLSLFAHQCKVHIPNSLIVSRREVLYKFGWAKPSQVLLSWTSLRLRKNCLNNKLQGFHLLLISKLIQRQEFRFLHLKVNILYAEQWCSCQVHKKRCMSERKEKNLVDEFWVVDVVARLRFILLYSLRGHLFNLSQLLTKCSILTLFIPVHVSRRRIFKQQVTT